jgi:copper(I)-binding protein
MSMRRNILRAALLAGAAFIVSPAIAHDFRAGDLAIGHPWTRAVGANAPTAAGYLTIRNTGSTPDRLVGAETPRARAVELHEMTMTDGVMRMRPISGGIEIAPGAEVKLAPGGLHLMIQGPQGGFQQGEKIPVTLVFERAGRVAVELAVDAPGARGGAQQHDGHGARP